MFKQILIANRGEIACRIIRTCRRLGVETVAVYSDADAGALHVRLADRAVRIGGAAAADSYLNIGALLEAARETGAEAVHPGYGFLAENAEFARQLDKAGLVLIGPTAETIEAMGSKARAKSIMEKAGVPLVPGYHGDDQSDERLAKEARRIGFPLMLKAAAGGGGKGMRAVRAADDFQEALGAARREAQSAFGDERMILERYLERPRHIEAQIFGDANGNIVHLFERDCSSQRRHQKVIEEAPAPGLDESLRRQLLDAAVRAGQAVDYRGAGTVEFLVDGDEYFFLEMNTRLQVEHPVTEMITGQDLVEWQLRVAAGEPLPLEQDRIGVDGHAMEARIYAEDPARNFLPGSGRVRRLSLPAGDRVRVDSGVAEGDPVSVHYDPMIAKLIVHGRDRERCRARLDRALAGSFVGGLVSNLGFLQQLAATPEFAEGRFDTGLLDRDLDRVLDAAAEPPAGVVAAAACRWLQDQELEAAASVRSGDAWRRADGWHPAGPVARSLDLEVAGRRLGVSATGTAADGYRLAWDGFDGSARLQTGTSHELILELDGMSERLAVHHDGERIEVAGRGRRWTVLRHTRFESVSELGAGSGRIAAPMPGRIIQLRVATGDEIGEGQVLAVMEAMKMELSIRAPMAGKVADVTVSVGDLVDADAPLLQIETP